MRLRSDCDDHNGRMDDMPSVPHAPDTAMQPSKVKTHTDPAVPCPKGHANCKDETTSVAAMPPFALVLRQDNFENAKAKVILLIQSRTPELDTTRVVKRQVNKWTWYEVDAWQVPSQRWLTRAAVAQRSRAFEIARLRAWLETDG